MDTTDRNAPPQQQPRAAVAADDTNRRRVCYYYDPSISFVDYGENHVMVPHRVTLAHALVKSYGLLDDMVLLKEALATEDDLKLAHRNDYLKQLRSITPDTYNAGDTDAREAAEGCGLGVGRDPRGRRCATADNPVLADLWDYCLRYAGGSLAAARALASGAHDVAIHWAGGMHHAAEGAASGFCYVNDIVVAVRALLALGPFRRVLYVDIDAHHGDGVQRAFEREARVMTVSFHQYDGTIFFPRTGSVDDVGGGSLNVPLEAGTGDARYHWLFAPVMEKVMGVFRPDAVVLQCGADSLAGDRLAGLRLSVRGHARCVQFLRDRNLPLLLLGGGGYSINHVASCWCYETAVAIGREIPDDIPDHGYQHYYRKQGYKLHYPTGADGGGADEAPTKYMEDIKMRVMQHLEHLSALMADPSAQPDEEPRRAVDIDGAALVDRSARARKEDPVEKLHRWCGEEDLDDFLIHLGMKKRKMADACG